MTDYAINIKASAQRCFEKAGSYEKSIWSNTSNCYGYAISNWDLKPVNLGSLTLGENNNADNCLLSSSSGLQKLLDRDGWLPIAKKDIDPLKMHVIGVFGFRPMGCDFNEFHCFRLNSCGSFSEKLGAGGLIRAGKYDGSNAPLTIENLESEYTRDVANSVLDPVFSGFYRISTKGLDIHPRHFRSGAPGLMRFYPYYS